MLKPFEHEGVKCVKCGTEVDGKVLYWVHFYLFKGILFDSVCPNISNEVAEFALQSNVKTILVTHYHEDHIGGAIALQRMVPVFAPRKSIDILFNPPNIPEYLKTVWGQPASLKAKPLDEINLEDIKVMETPGHTFDHTSFLVEDRVFAGDLIIRPGQMVIFLTFTFYNFRINLKHKKGSLKWLCKKSKRGF